MPNRSARATRGARSVRYTTTITAFVGSRPETRRASRQRLPGQATDGDIGKVDDASYEVGAGYVVVDTGPWILGKKVMLPAGVISRVDVTDKKVHVDRTKDEIKAAPEFDEKAYKEREYRDSIGGYYGTRGRL